MIEIYLLNHIARLTGQGNGASLDSHLQLLVIGSINQLINQSINQSINHAAGDVPYVTFKKNAGADTIFD